MSGTVTAGGAVSIPASVGKIIQDIKEIGSNHLDEEIYAMLKECNMDPNETAQQLLSQDPFQDVKRKQDKRKEQNANTINSGHTMSRPYNQGRGGRGAGIGNYLRRYMARENGGHQSVNKNSTNTGFPPLTTSQYLQTKINSFGTSSLPASTSGTSIIANGLSEDAHPPQNEAGSLSPAAGPKSMADVLKSRTVQQSATRPPGAPVSTSVTVQGQSVAGFQQYVDSVTSKTVSGVYSSLSGPVLVPKLNSRVSGAVGTIKREVGTVGAERVAVEHATGYVNNKPAASSFSNHLQRTQAASSFSNNLQRTESVMSHPDMSHAVDSDLNVSENEISGSTTVHSFSKERVASKSQTKEQPQVSTSTPAGYAMSRSSVMANNYMRPRNLIGSQKVVGPNKEWKSKPTNQNVVSNPLIIGTSTVSDSTSAVSRSPSPVAKSTLQDTPSKLQKISEELNVRVKQHVIIPNHLQLPEAELIGIRFGRFDANFMYQARFSQVSGHECP